MPQLPEGWASATTFEDQIVADGLLLHRAGLSSTAPSGEEVTGSAAGTSPDVVARGRFELLERAATLEALHGDRPLPVRTRDDRQLDAIDTADAFPASDRPERWRYARSNGVALHGRWETACDRALWELVERDRVLRAWYGELAPRRLRLDLASSPLRHAASYAWEAHAFDDPSAPPWAEGLVATGVFGFPARPGLPMVLGYGVRPGVEAALATAACEAAQLLAFLWGEELPAARPEPGPTAMHHLEHLLWPQTATTLRRWLGGEHLAWGAHLRDRRRPGADAPPRFADLTPPWLAGGLRVAKALVDDATPLTFGDAPLPGPLPTELRSHPIA